MINQHHLNSTLYSSIVMSPQQDSQIQSNMTHSILHPQSLSNSKVQSQNYKHPHQTHHFPQSLPSNSNIDFPHSKTQRQLLLQKRKSYADSIRSKNKAQIQSNNLKNINKKPKISLNSSRNLTFQSQISSPTNRENQYISQLQNQHFSTQKIIDQNVFRQINPNSINLSNIGLDSEDILNKIKVKGNQNKNSENQETIINKQLHSYRESYSHRKKTQNKQNNLGCSTHRKNSSKNTSYAQIFDKKNTINALLTHQRGKNLSSNKKNQNCNKNNFSISSIASPTMNCKNNFQNCLSLEKFQCNINGFMMEEFDFINKIQDISNIQYIASKQLSPPLENQSKLSYNSKVIQEKIDFSQKYQQQRKNQEKQITLLGKQNATFKRQLASFRKQNSNLKKQIQNYKKYIEQLQQKAAFLLQQQQKTSSLISPELQIRNNHDLTRDCKPNRLEIVDKSEDGNLVKILQEKEKETYLLRQNNKALELRVFMLEKRIVQEEECNKKKLALQVSSWRDKYNKLKNQNAKLKNSFLSKPSYTNLDYSISMQISRDESI